MLDRPLANYAFVVGDSLSIADIAIWPWAQNWQRQEQDIANKPHFARWLDALAARPVFIKGKAVSAEVRNNAATTDRKTQEILFGKSPD